MRLTIASVLRRAQKVGEREARRTDLATPRLRCSARWRRRRHLFAFEADREVWRLCHLFAFHADREVGHDASWRELRQTVIAPWLMFHSMCAQLELKVDTVVVTERKCELLVERMARAQGDGRARRVVFRSHRDVKGARG